MIIPTDITQLFRTEYSKLIAVLCKTYGLGQIEIAEDIVTETFLLATETWNSNEIPESPVGWLYTVAKNKTKDYLKRKVLFEKKVALHLAYEVEKATPEPVLDLSDHNITDGQLQMLFAIIHPSMQKEIQIVLALRILCGFNTEQIASALLNNTATIN